MIFTMLFGIALALSLMLLVSFLGNRYINNKYLSDEKKTERYEIYKNELQEYVTNNNLTSDDTAAIADWAEQHKYLYLLIFNGEELLFESGQYTGSENNPEMGENKENDDDSAQNSGTSDDADKTPGEDNVTPPGDTESGDDNPDTPSDGGDGGASDGDGGVTDGTGDGSDTDSSDDKTDDKTDDNTNDKTEDKTNDKNNDKTNDKNNSYTSSVVIVRSPTREELLAYAEANGSYPVYTNDNSVLLASMADYTEYFYYEVINILSVAVAVITFIIIMLLHFAGLQAAQRTGTMPEFAIIGNKSFHFVGKRKSRSSTQCTHNSFIQVLFFAQVNRYIYLVGLPANCIAVKPDAVFGTI